jgi:hypothetical protein
MAVPAPQDAGQLASRQFGFKEIGMRDVDHRERLLPYHEPGQIRRGDHVKTRRNLVQIRHMRCRGLSQNGHPTRWRLAGPGQ